MLSIDVIILQNSYFFFPFIVFKGEILCPVCRRLVNGVLPTLPGELHTPLVLSASSIHSTSPFANSNGATYSLRIQEALDLLKSAANAVGKDQFLKAIPLHHIDETRPNVENFSLGLSKMYFPGKQDKLSRFSKVNHSLLMWDTLKYSLTSMEIVARCGKTSLTPNFALSAMYKELESSSGFILYMLLKLVQKTRSKNSIHVLQRFRGVQLFAESICSGVSLSHADNVISGRGIILVLIFLFLQTQKDLFTILISHCFLSINSFKGKRKFVFFNRHRKLNYKVLSFRRGRR